MKNWITTNKNNLIVALVLTGLLVWVATGVTYLPAVSAVSAAPELFNLSVGPVKLIDQSQSVEISPTQTETGYSITFRVTETRIFDQSVSISPQ